MNETLSLKNKISFKVLFIYLFMAFIQIVHGFYAIYDNSPPALFKILGHVGIFWLIGDWFMKDSKKNKVEWAFDMGFFLYLLWPIIIPYYLYKTRGFKTASIYTLNFIGIYSGSYLLSYEFFYIVMP